MNYDIFISYKRKSINLANNLYYRLTKRGYRVFFDLDEMKRDRFDEQLYNHIRNAKDLIVVLEEGSLKAIDDGTYLDDWFCKELMFALKEGKNIIPLLLEEYKMPKDSYFPDELKELSYKNALLFGGLNYFEEYIDKLESHGYITAKPTDSEKEHSVFKFYSEEDCKVYADGKLIGDITGKADEPFYFFVKRKGKYRFKANNNFTGSEIVITEQIDNDAEEIIDLKWPERELVSPEKIIKKPSIPTEDRIEIKLGEFTFNMIRVDGGKIEIGATNEQIEFADSEEYPAHHIHVNTFYISEFPVTQNLYKLVMGYNKSQFNDEFGNVTDPELKQAKRKSFSWFVITDSSDWWSLGNQSDTFLRCKFHNPVETVSLLNAQEFCRRLSNMTNLKFSIPTEEEWEYAARGGQKSQGYIYAGSNDIDEVAWYRENGEEKTHPVGLKKPNELGIYDMSGNVWEWTETKGHSYQDGSSDLGGTYYVRRGGSWWHEASNCRVSKRYMSDQNKKTKGLGFRIVMRIESKGRKEI